MALYHGKGGSVTFAGTLLHLTSITLSSSVGMADSTEMGDSWRDFLYGLTDWTATMTMLNADSFDTAIYLGVSGALVISLVAGDTITATAICTGLSEEQPVDGIGTITLTFVGNDADGFDYAGMT